MLWAKKSLGQNFLISERPVGAIVSAGEIVAGEKIIEIGPGKGVLTRALLAAGAHVTAIEKDDRLIPVLTALFAKEIHDGSFTLIHGDIMEMSEEKIAALAGEVYKVIANIPYYITGALIRSFLSAHTKPSCMVLMVQKEVADRIIARDAKESILSVSVKIYAIPELIMKVARGNFFPIPNVDSAVIKLGHIQDPFKEDTRLENKFFEVVKAGFAQKRKKLIKNLEPVMTKEIAEKAFLDLKLDTNTRAEDVTISTWLQLCRY